MQRGVFGICVLPEIRCSNSPRLPARKQWLGGWRGRGGQGAVLCEAVRGIPGLAARSQALGHKVLGASGSYSKLSGSRFPHCKMREQSNGLCSQLPLIFSCPEF